MTTRFATFKAETSGDGSSVTALSSASLYLDTSDLSCLLLGRLQQDVIRPVRWRAQIEALLAADRVRLRISPIHLAEMALRPELYTRALNALAACPNVYLVTCKSDSVFRVELERQEIVFEERPFSASDLLNFDLTTR